MLSSFGQLRIAEGLSIGQVAKRAGTSREVERRAQDGLPVIREQAEKLVKAMEELLGRRLPASMCEELVHGMKASDPEA